MIFLSEQLYRGNPKTLLSQKQNVRSFEPHSLMEDTSVSGKIIR